MAPSRRDRWLGLPGARTPATSLLAEVCEGQKMTGRPWPAHLPVGAYIVAIWASSPAQSRRGDKDVG